MLKKSILMAALAGSLIAVPFLSLAHGGYKHGGKHYRGGDGIERIERMATRHAASDEQSVSLRALADKYRPMFREIGDRFRENSKAMHELSKAESLDQAKLKSLADAKGDIVADKIVLRAQMRAEFKGLLTEEQRARYKERGHGRHHGKKDSSKAG